MLMRIPDKEDSLIKRTISIYVVVNFLISVNFYFSIVFGNGNVC